MENINQTSSKIKLDFKDSKYATGRRKTSIAKVLLKKGTGKIIVNGKKFEDYFTRETHKMQILRPFEIVNQSTDYDVKSNVVGGGHTGQAGALVHGISRALIKNLTKGSVQEGGSTITQQLARTVFLSQERTLIRMIKEAALAVDNRTIHS